MSDFAEDPGTDTAPDDAESQAKLIMLITGIAGLLSVLYLYKLLFGGPKKALPLEDYQPFPLIRKEILSHDTRRFTFGLPSPQHILGLPIGQHVSLKFTDPSTGKPVIRSYTPVESAMGECSLCIKVYKPAPPKFPAGGLMSQHLESLQIGDTILLKGPKGHVEIYQQGQSSKPAGSFHVKPLGKPAEERYVEQIGMMAGGTGITPMLQVLHELFRNDSRYAHISVKMIYANQSPDDILVRPELEALQKEFPNRFQLWYTVDRLDAKEEKDWKYSKGFIDQKMVEDHLMFEDKNKPTQFMMCGPPPMLKFAAMPALKALGYSEKDWVTF